MEIALFIYVYLGLFYFGFLAYAAAMDKGGLAAVPGVGKWFCWWIFTLFLVMDILFNVSVGTLLFLQLPTIKTGTFSKRLSNNITVMPDTWRGKLAKKIVDYLLLPYTSHY